MKHLQRKTDSTSRREESTGRDVAGASVAVRKPEICCLFLSKQDNTALTQTCSHSCRHCLSLTVLIQRCIRNREVGGSLAAEGGILIISLCTFASVWACWNGFSCIAMRLFCFLNICLLLVSASSTSVSVKHPSLLLSKSSLSLFRPVAVSLCVVAAQHKQILCNGPF